jgi:hypothetical protein
VDGALDRYPSAKHRGVHLAGVGLLTAVVLGPAGRGGTTTDAQAAQEAVGRAGAVDYAAVRGGRGGGGG